MRASRPGPSADEVLDLVARLAQRLLAGGYEGTLGVENCLRSVADAYGYRVEVTVLAESAVLVIGEKARVVSHVSDIPQLDQVSAFKPWLADVASGRVPIEVAGRRLEEIAAMPPPYRPWLRVFGVMLFSIGFGISIQPTWQELWVTAVLGFVVGLIKVGGELLGRPPWLAPLFASLVVSLAVLFASGQGWVEGGTVEMMIPVLFVFIPGDAITMAMIELSVGRITAGAARLPMSLTVLGTLAFGPVLAAAMLDVQQSEIFGQSAAPTLGPWAGWFGWVLFTVGLMLVFGMRIAHGLRGLDVLFGGSVAGVQDFAGMFALIGAIALGMLTATGIFPQTVAGSPYDQAKSPGRVGGKSS